MFCAGAQNSWSGAAPPIPRGSRRLAPRGEWRPGTAKTPVVRCGRAARESQDPRARCAAGLARPLSLAGSPVLLQSAPSAAGCPKGASRLS